MNLGKETELIEFKESLIELDAGIKSITAMLNNNTDATIYFGVKDNGDVKGIEVGDMTFNKIVERIKVRIKPTVLPVIKIYDFVDDKKYIEVKVSGSSIPYANDGRYYIRKGARDEQVTADVLKHLFDSFTDDMIREVKALSQDLTFEYLKNNLKKHNVHIVSDAALFESYHLKTKGNVFNMTAYLLSDQNIIPIRVIRFDGIDKVNMLDKKEFTNQSILKTFDEVIAYLCLYNTSKVDLHQAERKETPLFDTDSLREAVINAFIHNEWKNETPPTIFVYEDRMEILSYGELPYKLTKESFFNGQSIPINRGLFTIFMLCRIAEQSGHGVPTIVKKYGKDAFDFSCGRILITIEFAFPFTTLTTIKENTKEIIKKPQRNPKETPKKPQRNPKELEIIELMKGKPTITVLEISDSLGSTPGSVQHYIDKLKDEKVIRHEGSTKAGCWVILE